MPAWRSGGLQDGQPDSSGDHHRWGQQEARERRLPRSFWPGAGDGVSGGGGRVLRDESIHLVMDQAIYWAQHGPCVE